jgi:hypothetical protein
MCKQTRKKIKLPRPSSMGGYLESMCKQTKKTSTQTELDGGYFASMHKQTQKTSTQTELDGVFCSSLDLVLGWGISHGQRH